jgi:electron transfer flavoprotein beta subunit
MKIAVLVKEVPDQPAPRLDPDTLRLDRSGTARLNPSDANGIEEALRLREQQGGEVVLISMGPPRAVETLRKGLAMGADRAVLISDQAAAGSDLVATSAVLAAALERERPDLVFVGQQAADGGGAVLGAAVADRLRLPFVSQAAELVLDDGDKVELRRQTEFGYERILAPLPAVVAVSDAINEPRYPSLKGILGARQKPQETLTIAELALAPAATGEPGSRTAVRALSPPPSREETLRIAGDGQAAEKIVEFLVGRKLL